MLPVGSPDMPVQGSRGVSTVRRVITAIAAGALLSLGSIALAPASETAPVNVNQVIDLSNHEVPDKLSAIAKNVAVSATAIGGAVSIVNPISLLGHS